MRQALAFKSLAENGKALSLIGRYESRLKRDYRNAIKALEDLRHNRGRQTAENEIAGEAKAPTDKLPNEPKEPLIATDPHQATRPSNVPNEPHKLPTPNEPVLQPDPLLENAA